jgi:hypothetical protein
MRGVRPDPDCLVEAVSSFARIRIQWSLNRRCLPESTTIRGRWHSTQRSRGDTEQTTTADRPSAWGMLELGSRCAPAPVAVAAAGVTLGAEVSNERAWFRNDRPLRVREVVGSNPAAPISLLPGRRHRQETAKATEWIGVKAQLRDQVIPEQAVGPWAFDCYLPCRTWLVDRRGEDCQAGLLPPEQGMGKIGLRLRMTWLNQDDASNPTR